MLTDVIFYVLGAILIAATSAVIFSRNPVHSALFLILAFFTAACLWIMMNAEYLALVLIVVYVGAVMVLFLFVIMLTDIRQETALKRFYSYLPLALVIALVLLLEIAFTFIANKLSLELPMNQAVSPIPNSNLIGYLLYTKYSYPVELASLILLLALVVAVVLVFRPKDSLTKYQEIDEQLRADPQERVKLMDLKQRK